MIKVGGYSVEGHILVEVRAGHRRCLRLYMKILSWNVCGLGSAARRLTVNELLHRNKVQIALVRESKFSSLSEKIVEEVWGSRFVNWVSVDAVGSAGGFLLLWDTRHVTVSNNWKGEFTVSVEVEDLASNS